MLSHPLSGTAGVYSIELMQPMQDCSVKATHMAEAIILT